MQMTWNQALPLFQCAVLKAKSSPWDEAISSKLSEVLACSLEIVSNESVDFQRLVPLPVP